jgi:hypothetical protein
LKNNESELEVRVTGVATGVATDVACTGGTGVVLVDGVCTTRPSN